MRRAIPLVALFLLPLPALADVYSWKDADGRIHYSDKPPATKVQGARSVTTEQAPDAEIDRARQQNAEKRLTAAEKAKTDKEAAEKSAKQRADDERRAANCERTRRVVDGLESGRVRFRQGGDGEREALDDSAREAELAAARQAMEEQCSPRAEK